MRVAGTDPGTSRLDVVVLDDLEVVSERSWSPEELSDASALMQFLNDVGPLDLIAAPSGYGLPLVSVHNLSQRDERLMTLVRDGDARFERAVIGLSRMIRALRTSALPALILPGGVHLPTIREHRKVDRIDMATPDKICVAALAIDQATRRCQKDLDKIDLLVVEIGTAFSGVLVVKSGRIVDARCGSFGPMGLLAGGAWDGEVAYAAGGLSKDDLFAGGVGRDPQGSSVDRLCESVLQTTGGLAAVHTVDQIVLQAHGLTNEKVLNRIESELGRLGNVDRLQSLPGAKLKCAAQGAALVADGLAGGRMKTLVERLEIRNASGSVLDHLRHPAAKRIRALFER